MQTVVNKTYSRLDEISIEERTLPPLKDDEVQINIKAASLNKADLLLAKGKPFMIRLIYGFKKPKYIFPGSDFSGEVVAIGKEVNAFKPGDQVFGELSSAGFGAFAEMINIAEKHVWHAPKGYSHLEVAAFPMPIATALEALKIAGDLKDKKVLVYGASGGVGRFLVQLLISFGATVHTVAGKKHREDLKNLHVSQVYDYQDPSFKLPKHRYDVIFGVNGYQSMNAYANALVKKGQCIIIGGSGKQLFSAMTFGWFYKLIKGVEFSTVIAKSGQDVLKNISEVSTKTKLDVQIGKIYALSETKQAYLDFDAHVNKGKYIIDMTI